jgi:hypothetical protein
MNEWPMLASATVVGGGKWRSCWARDAPSRVDPQRDSKSQNKKKVLKKNTLIVNIAFYCCK